jgi:hypothetical protein
MDNDFSLTTSRNTWSAEIIPGTAAPVSFSFYGKEVLQIQAAAFSKILTEKAAEPQKSRLHESVDGLAQRIKMDCLIPFGSEPRIRRSLDFYGNYCKVITDLELFSPTPVEYISVDPIRISEPAKRIGIIQVPAVGEPAGTIEWTDNPDGEIYNSTKPFLLVLVELNDGKVLEIGTGDDLWRWNASETEPDTTSEFTIIADDSGVSITRKILIWDERTMIARRNRRTKWYFAWSDTILSRTTDMESIPFDFKAKPPAGAKTACFDCSATAFPDFTHTTVNGEPVKTPCFHAMALLKRMRKWVRSAAGAAPGCQLILQNVQPHLCDSAVHMDRGKLGTMLHWDVMSLVDFSHWADQQLQKNGGSLRLAPPAESSAAFLPSMRNN